MSVNNQVEILIKEEEAVPKLLIAIIIIVVTSLLAIFIFMRIRPGSKQEVTAGQELVIGVDRATLYVPKDAATLDGVISISSLEPNSYSVAAEKQEWFRSQVVDVQYLNRQGVPYLDVVFPKPVLICFLIKERWADYTWHPDEYLVQYYAEEQRFHLVG